MRHYVRIICGVVLVLIFFLLSANGVLAVSSAGPLSGDSWPEYRKYVLETLKRVDANINAMNKKLDKLTGSVMAKTEEHSVAIGRLRAQNGIYAGVISLAMSGLVLFGGGYISRRIRFNGKVIEDGK